MCSTTIARVKTLCPNDNVHKLSDSGHPVTYARIFFTNKPYHKIYRCMLVRSTQHHKLLHTATIIHTKTFFAPDCHPRQIYWYISAHSTRHRTLLHNLMILHTKTFLCQPITRARKYLHFKIRFKHTFKSKHFPFSFFMVGVGVIVRIGVAVMVEAGVTFQSDTCPPLV